MLLKFRATISQRRVPGVCLPSNATSRGRSRKRRWSVLSSTTCASAFRSVKPHDQTGVPVGFKKLRIRLDQSVNRLDAIDTTQPCSRGRFGIPRAWPRPLPTFSRLPTMYTSDRSWPTSCARRGLYTPDTCPCNSPSPQSVTQAFNLSATEATQRWHKIAGLLTHAGRTPNGRRRSSV
jgi:hypothetical protein